MHFLYGHCIRSSTYCSLCSKRYAVEGSLSAADYYILAKFLEHYIQENNIQGGLEAVSPFMDEILTDNVESGKKAINKAIFHRDMFDVYLWSHCQRAIVLPKHLQAAPDIDLQYLTSSRALRRELIDPW